MDPREDAAAIFRAAVDRVDPAAMIERALSLETTSGGGERLLLVAGGERFEYALDEYDRIVVVGMGKASAKMALGLESVLGDRISKGLVLVKELGAERSSRIDFLVAGHPVPDERSVRGAREILALAADTRAAETRGERCLVFVLISGGGSALLCAPPEGLDLAEQVAATRLLLGSGATIQEMNTIRKHLSAVKGGRLAKAFAPAALLALVLSDVVGDDFDSIASGPTVPDPSTWAEALEVIRRRGLETVFPARALDLLRRGAAGDCAETPKSGDVAFARTRTLLLGTNRLALLAAEAAARRRGYHCLVLSSRITGEAREAALFYLGMAEDIAAAGFPLQVPACIIAGGETTVTLHGEGRGGRNQEMSLSFLANLGRSARKGSICFLSAGTDGNDGPTDAAGAFATYEFLGRARDLGLDPETFLAENDSYAFHERLGSLFKTGATGTNVCDIQVLIVT